MRKHTIITLTQGPTLSLTPRELHYVADCRDGEVLYRAAIRENGYSESNVWRTRRAMKNQLIAKLVAALGYTPAERVVTPWEQDPAQHVRDIAVNMGHINCQTNHVWAHMHACVNGIEHKSDFSGPGYLEKAMAWLEAL